jgi:hypothetical protein
MELTAKEKTRERHAREMNSFISCAITSKTGSKMSRETYRKIMKINKLEETGDEKAKKIISLIDEKAISIDMGFRALYHPDTLKEVGLHVKVPPKMRELLKSIAKDTGATMNEIVNAALMEFVTQIFGEEGA